MGVAWLNSTCGTCRYCLSERENLCEIARFTGYHADGAYAEYAVVSQDFAYPLPQGFPLWRPLQSSVAEPSATGPCASPRLGQGSVLACTGSVPPPMS